MKDDEIVILKLEVEVVKEEVVVVFVVVWEVENEVKVLWMMIYCMVLIKEEMEEVVLKWCWLVWYWVLVVKYGIYLEVLFGKVDFWLLLVLVLLEMVFFVG